jgi:hypothetical protein
MTNDERTHRIDAEFVSFFQMDRCSSGVHKYLLCFVLFSFVARRSSVLLDGIVTVSWLPAERTRIIERFLSNNTRIDLKVVCREPTNDVTFTQQQIKKKLDRLNKTPVDTNIRIRGRISRVLGCLPLPADASSVTVTRHRDDKRPVQDTWRTFDDDLAKRLEKKTFEAHQSDCDHTGSHLYIDQYSRLVPAEISSTRDKKQDSLFNRDRQRRERRAANNDTQLVDIRSSADSLFTWADGYYLIEIESPTVFTSMTTSPFDIDLIVSMRNRHRGYITADEYPAFVFYAVMCGIDAFFALVWLVWCAFYWKELLKIQFWIAGVILIGMIEKSAFVAEYDALNRNG